MPIRTGLAIGSLAREPDESRKELKKDHGKGEKKHEAVQLRKNRTLPSERLRNLKRIRAAPAVLAERKNLQDSKITLSGGFIMITREDVIEELKRRGYEAVAITRMKNGISFDGILIHDGRRVVPFIRTGTILDIR